MGPLISRFDRQESAQLTRGAGGWIILTVHGGMADEIRDISSSRSRAHHSPWSPYGYVGTPVSEDDLRSIFEAARWAPSSYNEQPWSYLVATQESHDDFERALSCLVEPNQAWAKKAPVLVLCITSSRFSRNGKPNTAAVHDLGLAAANICFEATARGLFVHQMIGIVPDRVRELYEVPDGHDPVTALTIGHVADPAADPSRRLKC